jgi:hypothetical protein
MTPLRNEICAHGVVIGEIQVDRRWKYVTLTSSGEIWLPVREDILFTIPALVPAELAARCGETEIAEGEVNIHARVEVLKRLKYIEKAVEDAYAICSHPSPEVYDAVKHRNPSRWARTTVAEVASLFFPEPNLIAIFATHKFLMNRPMQFVAHPHYHSVHSFNVRPQMHVDELQMIMSWTRLRDGPIQDFGYKAQAIIQKNKRSPEQSPVGTPSQAQGDHSWNFKDKLILSFLLRSLRPTRSTQPDPYSLGQSAILKAINSKGPPVSDEEVQTVLVKLGVIAPWQDLQVMSPELELDLEDDASSPRIHADNAVVAKAFSAPPTKGPLGPEDFYPSDPLESVRHDFGDVPVFVIDDANAEELDDGFSIERIPLEPDNFWVHVHIADPASVIPPTHVLAKKAAKQLETMYFLHRSWPLFPRSLVHSPQSGLSLGARKNLPNNVLTLSSKVNDKGDIVDIKVRAGIVQNINIVSYDAVDNALNLPPNVQAYPFGGGPPKPQLQSLPEPHVKDLRDLMLVSDRLVARRYRDGGFTASLATAAITDFQRIPGNIESPTFKPSVFKGFPEFRYSVSYTHDKDAGAHAMVAEMMKLGCRVVSRFCRANDIPVLRRVALPPIMTSEEDLQKLLDIRMPNTCVPLEEAIKYTSFQPPGEYSLEPKGHAGLGVPDGEGYVRATSPLRRYIDLVTHWQIHHALLGDSAPSRRYPFDAEELLNLGISVKASEKTAKNITRQHERYWCTAFLKRWAEDTGRGVERQDDPLKKLQAITLAVPAADMNSRKYQTEILIPIIGMRVNLVNLDNRNMPSGTLVPVDIDSFRLGVRPLLTAVLK